MSTTSSAAAVQVVTEDLRRWIIAQAEAGCTPETVLQAMRASGWDEDVAIEALESTLTGRLKELGLPVPPTPVAVPEPVAINASPRVSPGCSGAFSPLCGSRWRAARR